MIQCYVHAMPKLTCGNWIIMLLHRSLYNEMLFSRQNAHVLIETVTTIISYYFNEKYIIYFINSIFMVT